MSQSISKLAVGAKIEVPVLSAYQSRFGAKLVFKIADKNHSGYPANSVTLITEKIIQIMAFDAKEPNNSNSDRKSYGNNRYLHSNLLQWLNSNAAAGAWYSAQHSADQAPTTKDTHVTYNAYTSWAGFLAMLEPKFVAELLDTTQTVAKNTVTDGGSYETVTSKMFLASTTEVGLANENSIAEGSLLAMFSNDASRVAYPSTECYNNSDGYSNSSFAPYIIKNSTATAALFNALSNAEVKATPEAMEVTVNGVDAEFIGTYAPKSSTGLMEDDKYDILFFGTDGQLYYLSNGVTSKEVTINPFRAYIRIPKGKINWSDGQKARVRHRNSETTDIDTLESTDNRQQTTVIYDMHGRRVTEMMKGGMYIVNGRKVVVK